MNHLSQLLTAGMTPKENLMELIINDDHIEKKESTSMKKIEQHKMWKKLDPVSVESWKSTKTLN